MAIFIAGVLAFVGLGAGTIIAGPIGGFGGLLLGMYIGMIISPK